MHAGAGPGRGSVAAAGGGGRDGLHDSPVAQGTRRDLRPARRSGTCRMAPAAHPGGVVEVRQESSPLVCPPPRLIMNLLTPRGPGRGFPSVTKGLLVVVPSVAVVGATGAVGEIMRQVLAQRRFP